MSECRWCGLPATHEREVQPEQIDARTKQIIKAGISVLVCEQHNAMFDREEERKHLQSQIGRLEARQRRGAPYNPVTLDAARRRLEELDNWQPMRRTG
jgi:hypothetical protein